MKAEELIIDREIRYVMEFEGRGQDGKFLGYDNEEVDGSQVLVKVKEMQARGAELKEQDAPDRIELTKTENGVAITITFLMTVLRPQVGFAAAVQCLDCHTVHYGEVVTVDRPAQRFTIRPADEAHELHTEAWTQIVHLDR